MSDEIIYIAGPMSGYSDFNYPMFRAAAVYFRAQDHDIRCPVESGNTFETPYADCIKNDLKLLLEANAIALLPGWLNSRGARLELKLAETMNYKLYLITVSEDGSKFYLHPMKGLETVEGVF